MDLPALVARLDKAIESTRKEAGVPGATVGLWMPGRGSYIRVSGVADKATGARMTPGLKAEKLFPRAADRPAQESPGASRTKDAPASRSRLCSSVKTRDARTPGQPGGSRPSGRPGSA